MAVMKLSIVIGLCSLINVSSAFTRAHTKFIHSHDHMRRFSNHGSNRKTQLNLSKVAPFMRGGSVQTSSCSEVVTKREGGIWGEYMNQLEKRPVLTKSCTCCAIATVGDLISQRMDPKFISYNTMKLSTFSLSQFLYFGPTMHYWFKLLDTTIKLKSSSLTVLMQMTIDQSVGSVFIIGGFFYFFEFLEALLHGKFNKQEFWQASTLGLNSIRTNLWPTLMANWKLWPLANTINFALVPLQHRVLFSSIVALFWNVYLAGVMRK